MKVGPIIWPWRACQVVSGADERPFSTDFFDTPQVELPEASGLFDLSEHRLNDLLSQSVSASIARPPELFTHLGMSVSGSDFLLAVAERVPCFCLPVAI